MNRTAICINKFFTKRFFKAVYLLPVVLCVLLTCPLISHPALGGCMSDGENMSNNVPKFNPATWKPTASKKSSDLSEPNDATAKTTPPSTSPSPTFAKSPVVSPKAGEGGDHQNVTNDECISSVYGQLPDGAFAAVCSKNGDPTEGGWVAKQSVTYSEQLTADKNNYFNCSSFTPSEDGLFSVRKRQFAGLHFLLLDDLGTKANLAKLGKFKLSCLIETSAGNFQGFIILSKPITDIEEAERLQKALLSAGYGDEGASGLSRWARLPNAINGKPKHMIDGKPFQCRLVEWRPDKRYTPQEIVEGLKLDLSPKKAVTDIIEVGHVHDGDVVPTAKSKENPVITALKAKALYKTPLGSGKHDVTCPWVKEHTDALDTGACYFEPNEQYMMGGFCCQHSHRDKYKIKELLGFLEINHIQARNKPVIQIIPGELNQIVDDAEEALAREGRHFESGGLIVSIATDNNTGESKIVPINKQALTRELSIVAEWQKYSRQLGEWMRTDPSSRHVGILYDAMEFRHLPPLKGLARQPYFRESDGELVMLPGYDETSKLFGVFDPREFQNPEPTQESARSALKLLEDLLLEFRFVSAADKAAALSAIFTAVVRPTLPCAPAFHVRAPSSGSGKSYLCDLIGAFAGPEGNAKVSFPKTSDEATKVLLSLLLANPAVVEWDDMISDWIPHGVINRALTSEHITDRILGVSKTATVSTRSLFLGSGNNVGPVRDLLRRVLTINIDPRCSSPATIRYFGNPVSMVRQHRGKYVTAVLTIIQAWHNEGSPRTEVESIATYGGAWADYCRHPLVWLGLPDPATTLLQQVKHDPDADSLSNLMIEWKRAFVSTQTTVRKALDVARFDDDLMDEIKEFPVLEKGGINRAKFGWVLRKNANRIVNGLEFRRGTADGRTAWMVVEVQPSS